MKRVKGIVNWFSGTKRYGFISSDHGEIFVRQAAIIAEGLKTLQEGEWVEFEIIGQDKERQAVNLVKIS